MHLKYIEDFEIEDLGVQEDFVYDIEIEDNHNFFGNGILVHNSAYVNCGELVSKIFGNKVPTRLKVEDVLDKFFAMKMEPVLKKATDELAEYMNFYENALHMKREKINDVAVFVGKKRYILNTLNSEGVHYETPKISVTGIESVRSSTPRVCRDKMKGLFKILMQKDETKAQEFIADFFEEFMKLPLAEVAKNSGTEDITKWVYDPKESTNGSPITWEYDDSDDDDDGEMGSSGIYKKGCPIHVRGALLYNDQLEKLGLTKRYPAIQGGDKIKFIYLKKPNPIFENIISFIDDIPKEFGLHDYVDYELQFEKVFLGPMKLILDTVGWSVEKKVDLSDFFNWD